MKKIVALLLLSSLLLFTAMAFTSCDFQAEVDSARTELMNTAKSLLDPFLNRSESEITESSTAESVQGDLTDDSGIDALN